MGTKLPRRDFLKGLPAVAAAGTFAGTSVAAARLGAVRVVVNCNQMGQAVGVAAWLALDSGADVDGIDTEELRATLKRQGAVII